MSVSATRIRRPNAGSRMRALVEQQQQQDSLFDEDILDDAEDYVVEAQEDVFDEDFGSTDEEEEARDDEAQVHAEERAARKKAVKGLGITKRNPVSITPKPPPGPTPKGGRIEKKKPTPRPARTHDPTSIRQSNRSSTVASKRQLQAKMSEQQKRKAAIPQRVRVVEAELTQEEKLEEAKETERINLASLQKILEAEVVTRMRRGQRDTQLVGPLIRIRSFSVKVFEMGEAGPSKETHVEDSTIAMDVDTSPPTAGEARALEPALESTMELADESAMEASSMQHEDTMENSPDQQTLVPREEPSLYGRSTVTFQGFQDDPLKAWQDQPTAPSKPVCPITGLEARYRDPRTLIPYATKDAYAILKRLINAEYAWSPVVQAYIHPFDVVPPAAVPPPWLESTLGTPAPVPEIEVKGETEGVGEGQVKKPRKDGKAKVPVDASAPMVEGTEGAAGMRATTIMDSSDVAPT
ncbi:YL1 nuclear protein-domain-containing protein [Fimicolochytrium jonesii]|uniref:YL1 nuclear protein-domain-containing protein n=1 Tax=Fimicolochytrium jonesii TaxID=1396493 RepID=UPI0022FF3C3B|nr:YL1 nuclear protein-domain-containing protein [Fimicolochytrium jonesii]KAI8823713.1 YL1 nuclear protein-domain-containing protein [Fimicolochytrium jonesii]